MSSIQVAQVAMAFKPAHERDGCYGCQHFEKRGYNPSDILPRSGTGGFCMKGGFFVSRLAICKEHMPVAAADAGREAA